MRFLALFILFLAMSIAFSLLFTRPNIVTSPLVMPLMSPLKDLDFNLKPLGNDDF